MSFSPLIRQLIDSLRILPGVGQKTAQRMALQLLERDRSGGLRLAQALNAAMEGVGHCKRCRSLSEDEICQLCLDERRDDSLLCVVELAQWMCTQWNRLVFAAVTSCSRGICHRSMAWGQRPSVFLRCWSASMPVLSAK